MNQYYQSKALTPVQRFWNLLRSYRSPIRLIYVYAVFNGLVNLSLPLGIQAIITYIQGGEMTSSWLVLVGFVLFGIALTGIFQVQQLRIVEDIQQDIFARSGFEFAYRLPQIRFDLLDQTHAPELANRFFDTLTIQKGLPKILIDFSLAVFQIVFGLLLLAIYSSYFIILGFVLLLLVWIIVGVTGPSGLKTSLVESKYKYRLAHWLEDVARLNRSFKLSAYGGLHLRKTDAITSGYLKAREKHFGVLLNQFRLFIGFKVVLAAALLFLGGLLVFQDVMSVGQFVAAEIMIILIINSVEKVLRVIDTIYDVLTALEKIGYITDLDLDGRQGENQVMSEGGIALKVSNLKFKFPNSNHPILDNISFDIPQGGKVVVEGESGSGKTVLLQVLGGIHYPTEGGIYINGIPFQSYDRMQLMSQIGMAFPSNQLFEGTIEENITLGRPVEQRRLGEVLETLGLMEYINYQPMGMNSVLDSTGRRLPRSIIQKILLARIMVVDPQLIIMEDPMQFINEVEKDRIIDYIMSPERPWTVIVVADYPYWRETATQSIELPKSWPLDYSAA